MIKIDSEWGYKDDEPAGYAFLYHINCSERWRLYKSRVISHYIRITDAYSLIQDGPAYYLVHNCEYKYDEEQHPYCYIAGVQGDESRIFSYPNRNKVMCNKANRYSKETLEKFFFIARSLCS